MNDYEAK